MAKTLYMQTASSSDVSNVTPPSGSVVAWLTADGKMQIKKSTGDVVEIGGSSGPRTKTAFVTSPATVDEGGIYTTTLTSNQSIVLPTPADTSKVTTAELWLTQPAAAVSFTIDVAWAGTAPDFTTGGKTYCVTVRWDGVRWIGYLAYSFAPPAVDFSGGSASFTDGTTAYVDLSATPAGCSFATADTLPSGVTLSSAGRLSYNGSAVAATSTTTVQITASKAGYTSATASVAITMTAATPATMLVLSVGDNFGSGAVGWYQEQDTQVESHTAYAQAGNSTHKIQWGHVDAGDPEYGGGPEFTGFVYYEGYSPICGFANLNDGTTGTFLGDYAGMHSQEYGEIKIHIYDKPNFDAFPDTVEVLKSGSEIEEAEFQDCEGDYTRCSSTINGFPCYQRGNWKVFLGRTVDGASKPLVWTVDTGASVNQYVDIWGGMYGWVRDANTSSSVLASPAGTYGSYGMGVDNTELTVAVVS